MVLSISAFWIRYTSLPAPVRVHSVFGEYVDNIASQKTFSRYWDFSIPSAEVRPTLISKVFRLVEFSTHSYSISFQVNTTLQLVLMGSTMLSTIIPWNMQLALTMIQSVPSFSFSDQQRLSCVVDGLLVVQRFGVGYRIFIQKTLSVFSNKTSNHNDTAM